MEEAVETTETFSTEGLLGNGTLKVHTGGFYPRDPPFPLYKVARANLLCDLYLTDTTHMGFSAVYGFDASGALEMWFLRTPLEKVKVPPHTPTAYTYTTSTIVNGVPQKPRRQIATVEYHP